MPKPKNEDDGFPSNSPTAFPPNGHRLPQARTLATTSLLHRPPLRSQYGPLLFPSLQWYVRPFMLLQEQLSASDRPPAKGTQRHATFFAYCRIRQSGRRSISMRPQILPSTLQESTTYISKAPLSRMCARPHRTTLRANSMRPNVMLKTSSIAAASRQVPSTFSHTRDAMTVANETKATPTLCHAHPLLS